MEIIKNNPLCFVSESFEDRLDCEYYNPKYIKFYKTLESSNYPLKNLGDKDVAFITDGEHGNPDYVEDGILFLRAINIISEGIDLENNIKFISEKENKTLKRSELKPNDILLVIVGATIGKTVLVPENFGIANISRDIAKIMVNKGINPKYILFYLESFLGQTQINRYTTGFAQCGLYLKSVKQLKIILPPKNIQDNIVNQVEKYREIAKENLLQYKRCISDIENILREDLKIEMKEKKVRSFTTSSDELNDRMDNLFYSPNYKELQKKLKQTEKEGYCNLIKGGELDLPKVLINNESFKKMKSKVFKYVDLGNTEKDFGKIIGFEEDILFSLPTRARQIMKENDVLIPRPIGSTDGIVIVPEEFNGQLCSTGFIVVRPKNYQEAVLLWTIFKSGLVQKQFFYLQSGSLQPEISPNNFINKMIIPIPEDNIKEKIIKEVGEKIRQAQSFIKKHDENIKKSNEIFAEMILK